MGVGSLMYELLGYVIGKNLAGFVTRYRHSVHYYGVSSMPHPVTIKIYIKRNILGFSLAKEFTCNPGKNYSEFVHWYSRPLDSHDFAFCLKAFDGDTLIAEKIVNHKTHKYYGDSWEGDYSFHVNHYH